MITLETSHLFSDQESYNKFLHHALKLSEHGSVYFNNNTITKANFWHKAVEKIRATFGYVNRTSSELFEYQIIQTLTFGIQNKWIQANLECIGTLTQRILNRQPYVGHITLTALVEAIENIRNYGELKIDFNEFNKIYFKSHQNAFTKRSFRVLCRSFFIKICKCFSSKLKNLPQQSTLNEKDAVDDLQRKIQNEIRVINLKKEINVNQRQIEKPTDDKLKKDLQIITEYYKPQQDVKQEKEFEELLKIEKGECKNPELINPILKENPHPKIPEQQKLEVKKQALKEPVNDICDNSTKVTFPRVVFFSHEGKSFNLSVTGVSTRKKYFLKIYSVASYLQESTEKNNVLQEMMKDHLAKQLTLKWVYEASVKKVQEACFESFKHALSKDEYKHLQKEIETCIHFFDEDTKKGDEHVLRWLPGGYIEAFINGKKKGSLKNSEFAQKLWSVWFGPKSVVNRDDLIQEN